VDSDRLFLESLAGNRPALSDVAIVGWAIDAETGRGVIERLAPDVALLAGDCFVSGFRALGEITSVRLARCRLAIFADFLSESQLEVALAFPGSSLLSRRSSLSELADHIRAIGRGRRCIAHQLQLRLDVDARSGNTTVERRRRLRDFTNRQLEVLAMLAQGERVREIARKLDLSEKAVESHKYRLMSRLGLHDRVELCRWAIREGIIEP
jgi:DNA-binding NarL/FixJ family response regulator